MTFLAVWLLLSVVAGLSFGTTADIMGRRG